MLILDAITGFIANLLMGIVVIVVVVVTIYSIVYKIKMDREELYRGEERISESDLEKKRAVTEPKHKKYTYRPINYLCTKTEKEFYHSLIKAIGNEYTVFSKVRIADVLEPQVQKGNRNIWWKAFNLISAKHFDFILCHKESLKIKAAIELDDDSHQRQDRKLRDEFVNNACESASFQLIRFKVRQHYDPSAIKRDIDIRLSKEIKIEDQEPVSVGRA